MSKPVPPELLEFTAPYPDGILDIAMALRARVLDVMPNAHEFMWDATNAVSLVYTPTADWKGGVVHLACYTGHVNLGFNDGATLDDPLELLTGSGARIRHVTMRTVDDTAAPWIADYILNALEHSGVRVDAPDQGTTIRVSKGPEAPARPVVTTGHPAPPT